MQPTDRRTVLRAGAVALAGGLAGCGEGGGGGAQDSEITLTDNSFDPVRATVTTGTTVTWTNDDSTDHDVTAAQFTDDATEWSFTAELAGGEEAEYTFEEADVYEYHCTIHGEETMCGAVEVGGESSDASLPCESEDGGDVSYNR